VSFWSNGGAGTVRARCYLSLIIFPLLQAFSIAVAIVSTRRGNRSAWFVGVAFSMFFVGSTFSSIAVVLGGIFRDFETSPFVSFGIAYFWEIGSALEALLLSLALADRVRTANGERVLAQENLIDAARNDGDRRRGQPRLAHRESHRRDAGSDSDNRRHTGSAPLAGDMESTVSRSRRRNGKAEAIGMYEVLAVEDSPTLARRLAMLPTSEQGVTALEEDAHADAAVLFERCWPPTRATGRPTWSVAALEPFCSLPRCPV